MVINRDRAYEKESIRWCESLAVLLVKGWSVYTVSKI